MAGKQRPAGRDLTAGVAVDDVREGGLLSGHVGDENVLVTKRNGKLFAVSAKCTHYGGPLDRGLIVGGTVRCPWHHARFDLETGEAVGAPALNPVSCWKVDVDSGKLYVRERAVASIARRSPELSPSSVLIVGGGAAGDAAAETLRRQGYEGPVTILSEDAVPPTDRPNLSKDYLAGTAEPSWIPLRSEAFYREQRIDLRLNAQVKTIDPAAAELRLAEGTVLPYGALLLATGAEPVRLETPGADLPHVHYLRTQADSESIIAAVDAGSKRAVVIGASFIGLEVAASLRHRGVEVHVVAPETRPLERVMGEALGDYIRGLHEAHGVVFHLEQTAARFDADGVTLQNGEFLRADLVVVGIGVRPRTALAETAGLDVDRGVLVNEYLETSVPNIYAAGDIARWPDAYSGERIRVEHWVVAQRQGQAAARNILGARTPYLQAPFFWSQHYDVAINYVGHAARWDRIETHGVASEHDFSARFLRAGRTMAMATIYRDVESLRVETEMEGQGS